MKNKMLKVTSIVLALVLLMLTFAGCNNDPQYEPDENTSSTTETTTESTTQEVAKNINPLTGKADLSDSAIGARPIAIMIENSPDARPQWGITTPDIVIEGVVEGGVTRMMWIYADVEDIPSKVGPVRSARHDYVELAKGMNAIFVHWGGSDGAKYGLNLGYQVIKNLGVNNIDGKSYEGKYFFRDNTRNVSKEHRGITSGESIKKAISGLKYSTTQTVENWTPFSVLLDGEKIPWGTEEYTGACSEITVTFSTGYNHTFKYNKEENTYYNYLNSKVMTDGNNGEKMAVENVIVLYVPVKTLNTKEGHKEWNFELANGEGFYVSNGVGQRIYWSKSSKDGALKITDFNGKELLVNKGQSWIGIVPEENRSLTKVVE